MIGICSSLKRPCFKDEGGKMRGSSLKKPLSEDDGHENTHSSLKTPLFKDECLGELTFKPVEEILDARTAYSHLKGGWWIRFYKKSSASLLYYA